jgi:DNA-binding CsgD family transcriptional regulator
MNRPGLNPLSPREAEILALRERGVCLKEIAWALRISHNTAKAHMQRILGRLGAQSTLEAIYRLRPAGCATCPRGLAALLRDARRTRRGYHRKSKAKGEMKECNTPVDMKSLLHKLAQLHEDLDEALAALVALSSQGHRLPGLHQAAAIKEALRRAEAAIGKSGIPLLIAVQSEDDAA